MYAKYKEVFFGICFIIVFFWIIGCNGVRRTTIDYPFEQKGFSGSNEYGENHKILINRARTEIGSTRRISGTIRQFADDIIKITNGAIERIGISEYDD